MNISIRIFIVITIILFIVSGLLFYKQEKAIGDLNIRLDTALRQLEESRKPTDFGQIQQISPENPKVDYLGDTREELKSGIKDIYGKIIQVSDGLLIVEANMIDLSKLDYLNYQNIIVYKDKISRMATLPVPEMNFPMTKKRYNVIITKGTVLNSVDLKNLKIGDFIKASASDSIYDVSEFNAGKLSSLSDMEKLLIENFLQIK